MCVEEIAGAIMFCGDKVITCIPDDRALMPCAKRVRDFFVAMCPRACRRLQKSLILALGNSRSSKAETCIMLRHVMTNNCFDSLLRRSIAARLLLPVAARAAAAICRALLPVIRQ